MAAGFSSSHYHHIFTFRLSVGGQEDWEGACPGSLHSPHLVTHCWEACNVFTMDHSNLSCSSQLCQMSQLQLSGPRIIPQIMFAFHPSQQLPIKIKFRSEYFLQKPTFLLLKERWHGCNVKFETDFGYTMVHPYLESILSFAEVKLHPPLGHVVELFHWSEHSEKIFYN